MLLHVLEFVVEDLDEVGFKALGCIEERDVNFRAVIEVLVVLVLHGDHFLHFVCLQLLIIVLCHLFLLHFEDAGFLGQDLYLGNVLVLLHSHFLEALKLLL